MGRAHLSERQTILFQLLKEWVLADDHEWSGSGSALLKALLTRHAGRLE